MLSRGALLFFRHPQSFRQPSLLFKWSAGRFAREPDSLRELIRGWPATRGTRPPLNLDLRDAAEKKKKKKNLLGCPRMFSCSKPSASKFIFASLLGLGAARDAQLFICHREHWTPVLEDSAI